MLSFIVAFVFSAVVFGVSVYMLIMQFKHPEKYGNTCWPETTIAFILGVWVTDRPKAIKTTEMETKKFIKEPNYAANSPISY